MSRNKQKGTAFETLVVRWLAEHGFPYAERRSLSGVNARGDISGIVGIVIECKNHKTLSFSEWLEEAAIERDNANADYGIVVAKRKNKGDAADQYAVMRLEDLARLLKDAGY